MKTKLLAGFLITAAMSVAAFLLMTPAMEQEAAASPAVTIAVVDALGNEVPGIIPPHVIFDATGGVLAAGPDNWKRLTSFQGTDFSARLVGAKGYVDAGFTDTTGTVFTLDVPQPLVGPLVLTEDILVVVNKFTFGAPDAGASTTVLDVGISGTTTKFGTNFNMLASSTGLLGSGTGSTKARNIDSTGLKYRLTFTQSAKDLSTVNGGRVDIYVLAGNVPVSR